MPLGYRYRYLMDTCQYVLLGQLAFQPMIVPSTTLQLAQSFRNNSKRTEYFNCYLILHPNYLMVILLIPTPLTVLTQNHMRARQKHLRGLSIPRDNKI